MAFNPTARLFEDFNLPEKPAEDLPPPEPTFSAAELSAGRLEAWNEGYLAGAAVSADSLHRDGQGIFAEFLARSDELDEALARMTERNAAAIARWLVCTFLTAFPDLSNGSMAGRTKAVAELLQPALRSQTKIEVRGDNAPAVSFHTMYDVCRQIEAQQIENPSGGSIAIAWQQGEAELNPARTWEDIRSAIMPLAAEEAAAESFRLTLTQGESIRHVR